MIEKNIKIKDLNICYKVFERKTSLPANRRVLILHGWGSRSENWQRVGEVLSEKGIKVIIPDLPGFGNSDKPKGVWNLDNYCDFVEEFINNLGLEKFSLLGHSFGGSLAVKLSLRFPEKIDKLFLISAACFRRKSIKKRILFVIAKIFKIFSFIPFLRKAFYKFVVKSDYLYTDGIMRDIYLGVIKQDLSDLLDRIQVPTNIIWGEKDNITPLKQAKIINQKIKNSKLIVIPGADHDLNTKYGEKLAKAICSYIF